ncbi:2TM domain-containing protein [Winogradskyella alexanderae]|uniref:2TM domain-containing protein n=1 Tax=Winogradskyella alexanderae TaxID=2877123 RepID=A0ABS7XQV7_9FLAO|nr:2TM domain-containing protein [Winogradskyella alexanderae]MCA0132150.1 2TM domain-containing protein [Winogradskyella alexanderae]
MEKKYSNLSYTRAKNRVEREKGFYTHLAIYLVVNVALTGFKVWGDLNNWDDFINALVSINVLSTWLLWGIFLGLHFLSVKYGQAWEERKIEQFMNDELSNNSRK